MKYRAKRMNGSYHLQYKLKYWPFWQTVDYFGHGHNLGPYNFSSIEDIKTYLNNEDDAKKLQEKYDAENGKITEIEI